MRLRTVVLLSSFLAPLAARAEAPAAPAVQLSARVMFEALTAHGVVTLDTLGFDSGKQTVMTPSYPQLNEVAALLTAHPELALSIEVHTDSRGSAAFNERLSQERAEAVRAFLVHAGIEPKRLAAKGWGETKPRSPNTTADGRDQNRRVELVRLD